MIISTHAQFQWALLIRNNLQIRTWRKVFYDPMSWKLTENLPQSYLEDFFAVNVMKDIESK
jgi:hypothetical protein